MSVPELGRSQFFHSENSLKHLLTPDKWTNLTIFYIYMQNMERKYAAICREICRNMQEYAEQYAEQYAEICKKICIRINNMQMSYYYILCIFCI